MDKKIQVSLNQKLILISIILLLISAATVFFLVKAFVPPQKQADGTEKTTIKAELGPLYETEEFVVNITGSTGRRFLRTKMSLELSNEKTLNEIKSKLPMVNDSILMILSSTNIDELNTETGKETIKQRIKDKMNTMLIKGQVINIYYNSIVWQ